MSRRLHAALIGHPVAHSLSPALHAAAGRATGVAVRYDLVDTTDDQLEATVDALCAAGVAGFNVTAPLKGAIGRLVARRTPEAAAVAAINTVRVEPDGLVGHNTDVEGAAALLGPLPPGPVLVVGAGGAARAVAWALRAYDRGAHPVAVFNRDPAGAAQVAALVDGVPHPLSDLPARMRDAAVWINCLPPLGELASLPFDRLSPRARVIDLNYGARAGPTLAAARAAGREADDGLAMLVHQGLAAFRWWTGVEAPPSAVFASVARASTGAH